MGDRASLEAELHLEELSKRNHELEKARAALGVNLSVFRHSLGYACN
jgi:hypothetical protein